MLPLCEHFTWTVYFWAHDVQFWLQEKSEHHSPFSLLCSQKSTLLKKCSPKSEHFNKIFTFLSKTSGNTSSDLNVDQFGGLGLLVVLPLHFTWFWEKNEILISGLLKLGIKFKLIFSINFENEFIFSFHIFISFKLLSITLFLYLIFHLPI